MKETIKKLLMLQLQYNGISEEVYHLLSENERSMLVQQGNVFHLDDKHRKTITVVLTGGAFDVLHIGHILTLNEAKKYGDILVVAIAKDEHIKKKGREPVHPQEYRKVIVESLKPVDVALAGFDKPQKMIDAVKPDVIVYGYDQKEAFRPTGVKIVRLENRIDDKKFKSGKILETFGF